MVKIKSSHSQIKPCKVAVVCFTPFWQDCIHLTAKTLMKQNSKKSDSNYYVDIAFIISILLR